MPRVTYCPVCEEIVDGSHPHTEAFTFHFRAGKQTASKETLMAMSRMAHAVRAQFAPHSQPGWSTEADDEAQENES